jgi:hypothetical protein
MVSVPLSCRDVLMAKQFRNLIEINAGLNKPCGKGMPKIMKPEMINARFLDGFSKSLLEFVCLDHVPLSIAY